ncbi:hypothetical protein BaRGS_00032133 [Batillaria attramentaria]|uniref:Uncharacterized protein n=1 Tax=Batillaria attramentaria TaxID=370345 RepID=A0ABD0JNY7_9CAEN
MLTPVTSNHCNTHPDVAAELCSQQLPQGQHNRLPQPTTQVASLATQQVATMATDSCCSTHLLNMRSYAHKTSVSVLIILHKFVTVEEQYESYKTLQIKNYTSHPGYIPVLHTLT